MILAYLLLLTGLTISAVAIYYSVVGLTAIFSAAAIPIMVMGSALEVAKLVCASWLKANWSRAPRLMKFYMTTAVVVLMLITSMGIFGFLSKAHSDQSLVSGDVQSKIAIYDEKIKTARENIEADRKQLKQMDEAVDQIMARSTSEGGADKANSVRKSQARDRSALAKDIEANQKLIATLNDEAAPIRAEVRKVEAEVGPLKYIAAFIYGQTDESILERAVTWVIITIIIVFDPLAVIMLLASQMTFAWHRKGHDPLAEENSDLIHTTVPHTETPVYVSEQPTEDELHPVTKEDFESDPEIQEFFRKGKEVARALDNGEPLPYSFAEDINEPDYPEHVIDTETDLDRWNKMIEEAEKEVAKAVEQDSLQDRVARGESYIDQTGEEIPLDDTPDMERPGDYITPPEEAESKKKTYMSKDQEGRPYTKTRE